jgi:hypothetical protein
VASAYHYTSSELTPSQEASLLWCFAWFSFSEGCPEKAEKMLRQIMDIYSTALQPCSRRLAHTLFVLSMFCKAQNKHAESEYCLRKSLDLIGSDCGETMLSYNLIQQRLSIESQRW